MRNRQPNATGSTRDHRDAICPLPHPFAPVLTKKKEPHHDLDCMAHTRTPTQVQPMRWAALLRNQDNTPERGATRKRFTADPR
jgi:hypothetical protein